VDDPSGLITRVDCLESVSGPEISQYHRHVQGQGHIRVKKIFEKDSIAFKIYFSVGK
jgi:hypothetical protein